MLVFSKRNILEKILYLISPAYKRESDAKLLASIKWLVAHPEESCVIGEYFIKDGFGETGQYSGIQPS